MLRWMLLFAVVVFSFDVSRAADMPGSDAVIYGKAPRHGRTAPVEKESDVLFTLPEAFPRVALPPHTPVLLGSSTLPGYYGSNHSYDYQGPYYGGESINFPFRAPYTCGVLGYC